MTELFGIRLFDWLTLIAILLGPVVGAWVAGVVDSYKVKRLAKLNVFATLLSLKRVFLDSRRVEAINLVPFLFHDCKDVVHSWRGYIDSVNVPRTTDENIMSKNNEKMEERYDEMLFEISKVLRIPIQQKDIIQKIYQPAGWSKWDEKEIEESTIRRMIIGLGEGKSAIPILDVSKKEKCNSDGKINN